MFLALFYLVGTLLRNQQTISHENIYWPCGVVFTVSGVLAACLSHVISVSNCMVGSPAIPDCRVDNRITIQPRGCGANVSF